MSDRRAETNQANARLSTGPRSEAGKAIASRNATRHGLLSARLFLPDEDPAEFEALTIDLQATLNPIGTLELALIEKVAVNMWRQRRLVQAETAALDLERADRKIASAVSDQLGLGYGNELDEDDLAPFDKSRAKWCHAVIAEAEQLEVIDFTSLAKNAPLIFAQLNEEAEDDEETIEDYVVSYEHGLTGYIHELLSWCKAELAKAEKRPEILAIADRIRCRKVILPQRELELIARYQTTLDNQLYKALRALRDAQDWRMKTLEGSTGASHVGEVAA